MKNSSVVDFQEYKINKNHYTIGVLIGALRAELENGTVELDAVYGILTESVKTVISSDLAASASIVL